MGVFALLVWLCFAGANKVVAEYDNKLEPIEIVDCEIYTEYSDLMDWTELEITVETSREAIVNSIKMSFFDAEENLLKTENVSFYSGYGTIHEDLYTVIEGNAAYYEIVSTDISDLTRIVTELVIYGIAIVFAIVFVVFFFKSLNKLVNG